MHHLGTCISPKWCILASNLPSPHFWWREKFSGVSGSSVLGTKGDWPVHPLSVMAYFAFWMIRGEEWAFCWPSGPLELDGPWTWKQKALCSTVLEQLFFGSSVSLGKGSALPCGYEPVFVWLARQQAVCSSSPKQRVISTCVLSPHQAKRAAPPFLWGPPFKFLRMFWSVSIKKIFFLDFSALRASPALHLSYLGWIWGSSASLCHDLANTIRLSFTKVSF